MEELDKGLSLSLPESEIKDILSAFQSQIDAWGLAMPDVEPLVLDFGLGNFEKTGLIEFWIANEVEAGYCGKYLFVFDQQTCPIHHHNDKLETFFIVKGKVTMKYEGETLRMSPGDVLRVERGKAHSFTGEGAALLLEVSKPCLIDDNYFENRRIPIGGNFDSSLSQESST
jgi:D-lyxose ketol-isomerase